MSECSLTAVWRISDTRNSEDRELTAWEPPAMLASGRPCFVLFFCAICLTAVWRMMSITDTPLIWRVTGVDSVGKYLLCLLQEIAFCFVLLCDDASLMNSELNHA